MGEHGSGANGSQSTTASSVPDQMKQLVRLVLRMFYTKEYQLVMDLLVHNNIMTEDELCERLLFEKRQLRSIINNLKNDKFVSARMQLHTVQQSGPTNSSSSTQESTTNATKSGGGGKGGDAASGEKTARITYFYIDYMLFTNVLKYRLDLMRKRLEAEQRDTTSRASFHCSQCGNSYTDLEINHLYDRNTGKLFCTYCQTEVQEKEDQSDSHMTARARMSLFQSQVRDPIDSLLKECDGIHLSSASLEPEIKPLLPREGETFGNPAFSRPDHQWSGDRIRPNMPDKQEQITVTFNTAAQEAMITAQPVKERPLWLRESTVNIVRSENAGSSNSPATTSMVSSADSITQTLAPGRVPHSNLTLLSTSTAGGGSSSAAASGSAIAPSGTSTIPSGSTGATTSSSRQLTEEDIMSTLLAHERRGHLSKVAAVGPGGRNGRSSIAKPAPLRLPTKVVDESSEDDDGSSSSDDEHDDRPSKSKRRHEEDSDQEGHFYLNIQGQRMDYNDISPDMIRTMTQEERNAYIEMGRKIHSMME